MIIKVDTKEFSKKLKVAKATLLKPDNAKRTTVGPLAALAVYIHSPLHQIAIRYAIEVEREKIKAETLGLSIKEYRKFLFAQSIGLLQRKNENL